MSSFEWFLLIVVVVVVPLIIAVVVTLWTIDQANKRKRENRKDPQIGVKRKAALTPEEVAAHKAARVETDEQAGTVTINNLGADANSTETITSSTGNTITINNTSDDVTIDVEPDSSDAEPRPDQT